MSGSTFLMTDAVRGHRVAAGLVTLATCLAGVVIVQFGGLELPANVGFVPAFGSITFFANLLTAVLLFSQARATRVPPLALLGTAYLFSMLAIVPLLLALPGGYERGPEIGQLGNAFWLWCIRDAGFALCVLCFALEVRWEQAADRRAGSQPSSLMTVAACVVLVSMVVATFGLAFLPAMRAEPGSAPPYTLAIGYLVVGCNLVALAAVLLCLRCRTVLGVWLAVAMLAASVDAVVILYGGERFSLGWYVSRCLSAVTGMTVLAALLFELTSLANRVSDANRRLEVLSLTDGLTQIPNRRAFDAALASEWRRAMREQTALSLLMIDVDCFQKFNDLYSYPRGDACLRQISRVIQNEAHRAGDLAARVGGEEFAILLPVTEPAGALKVAGLVRAGIAALGIENAASPWSQVTVSIGIATVPRGATEADTMAGLVRLADAALYRAKQAGRNRTFAAGSPAASYDEAFKDMTGPMANMDRVVRC